MPAEDKPGGIIGLHVTSDRLTMKFEIVEGDKKLPGVTFSANELDALIANLASMRSSMLPEIPPHFPQGQQVHHMPNTTHFFGVDSVSRVAVLAFRNPGLGWLSFGLTDQELDRIHSSLQATRSRLATARSDKKH